MESFYGLKNIGEPFNIFSTSHIVALSIILLVNLLIFFNRSKLKRGYISYILISLLFLQQLSLFFWYINTDTWSLANSLPLHLCGASIILSIILLISKSEKIYEILYFWGLGGALQALITPDFGNYSYQHYRFYQFFFAHGLIISTVIFMTFVYSYRPTKKSVIRVFIITNIYTIFVGVINYLTGGNYLFIRQKPATPSLLDYLGDWPWYILSLEAITIITFMLLYLPFAIYDNTLKKSN